MKSKKALIIVALAAGLAFTGIQQVSARGWGGGHGGGGGFPCTGYNQNYQMMDEVTQQKVDDFRAGTLDLRKKIAMKRAEKRALMQSQTPDAMAVAKAEGELFDLRTEMQIKAQEAGMPMMGMGMGGQRGMRGGPGNGGPGQGYRMGPCYNQQPMK